MPHIAVILFLLAVCLGCSEPINDVGDAIIRGRLYIETDPYGLQEALPAAAGKAITITYERDTSDTTNHLFSTKTDAEGYFRFTSLKEGEVYMIRYREAIEAKIYSGQVASQPGDDTLSLTAALARDAQTGLIVRTMGPDGNTLGGVNHCLFASEALARGSDEKCAGSLLQFAAEANGYAGTFGLPAATYWLRSSLEVPNQKFVNVQSVSIQADKVSEEYIKFAAPAAAVPKNTLKVTVRDPSNAALSGVQVCLFTSRILSERDTCAGSTYSLATDASGLADTINLLQNTYYLYAELRLGDLLWKTRDVVTIDTGTVEKNLTLPLN